MKQHVKIQNLYNIVVSKYSKSKTKTNINLHVNFWYYQNYTNITYTFGKINKTKTKISFIPKNTNVCESKIKQSMATITCV